MIMVNKQKRWDEMSEAQQVAIIVLSVVQIALLLGSLWDIYRRPAEKINGAKGWWSLASFINFLGPIAYFTFGRK
jgi:hypothetical protein